MYSIIKAPDGSEFLHFLNFSEMMIQRKAKMKLPANIYVVNSLQEPIKIENKLDYDLSFNEEYYKNTFDSIIQTSGNTILYGRHGAGKTNFTRAFAHHARDYGKATFFANIKTVTDLKTLVGAIKEPAIIVLEEFDKIFSASSGNWRSNNDDKDNDQDFLLSMFSRDHTKVKHIFVINVNDIDKISDFMKSRPGRIRYSINFPPLTSTQVVKFLDTKEILDEITRKYIYATHVLTGGFTPDVLIKLIDEIEMFPDTHIRDILNRFNVKEADISEHRHNRSSISPALYYNVDAYINDVDNEPIDLEITRIVDTNVIFKMSYKVKKKFNEIFENKEIEKDNYDFGGGGSGLEITLSARDIVDADPNCVTFISKPHNLTIKLSLKNYEHKSLITQIEFAKKDN